MISVQPPPAFLTVVHPSGVKWVIHDGALADRICFPKHSPVQICLDELVSSSPCSTDSGVLDRNSRASANGAEGIAKNCGGLSARISPETRSEPIRSTRGGISTRRSSRSAGEDKGNLCVPRFRADELDGEKIENYASTIECAELSAGTESTEDTHKLYQPQEPNHLPDRDVDDCNDADVTAGDESTAEDSEEEYADQLHEPTQPRDNSVDVLTKSLELLRSMAVLQNNMYSSRGAELKTACPKVHGEENNLEEGFDTDAEEANDISDTSF